MSAHDHLQASSIQASAIVVSARTSNAADNTPTHPSVRATRAPATRHVPAAASTRSTCTRQASYVSGDFIYVTRHLTNALADNTKDKPVYVPLEGAARDVRILFLLQLNNRNSRQIRRLLRLIYAPHHMYYVHVDPRQHYMHQGTCLLSSHSD